MLLSRALTRVDQIEPADARAPVSGMIQAAIEECVGARSLLGKRIGYVLELAEVLAGTREPDPRP